MVNVHLFNNTIRLNSSYGSFGGEGGEAEVGAQLAVGAVMVKMPENE